MKKRGILAIAMLGVALVFSGCKKSEEINFETYSRYKDVDTTEYVTLGSYKDVKVSVDTFGVTDQDIKNKIEKVREENSYYVKAENDAISLGDKVTIQMSGTIDGKKNDGFSSDNFEFVYGDGEYIMDGFTANLEGFVEGDNVQFKITIPSTFSEKAFIGKEAGFDVTVKSVEQHIVPEFDDALVQKISEFNTVEEYKDGIVPEIKKEKLDTLKNNKKSEAWKLVSDASTVSGYPEGVIETKSKELEEKLNVFAMVNNMELEAYVNAYYGLTFEEYVKMAVKQELLLDAIGRAEKITLTQKEYETSLTEQAKKYGYNSNEDFVAAIGEDIVKEALLWDKVQNYIADQVTIVE